MRMRSYLLVSAACLGGVMAAPAVSTLAAAPRPPFQPQSGWAVSEISDADAGMAYCALARRFSENMVMTFARNEGGEFSMALDFQRDVFSARRVYTVTLSAEGQDDASRSFEVNPVSSKAFVIRLGKDEKFTTAMEKAGSLNVNIGGSDYRFEMPDLPQGQSQLASCLAGLGNKGAGMNAGQQIAMNGDEGMAPPPPNASRLPAPEKAPVKADGDVAAEALLSAPIQSPAPAVPVEAVSASEMPVMTPAPAASAPMALQGGGADSLQNEIQAIREENLRLSKALERERRAYEEKFMHSPDSNAVAELEEKIRILEAQNREYAAGGKPSAGNIAASPDMSAADAGKIESLQKQLGSIQEENSRLKDRLASIAAPNAAAADATAGRDMKVQLAAIQAENETLKSQLTQATARVNAAETGVRSANDTARVAELTQRVKSLESDNDRLRQAMIDANAASGPDADPTARGQIKVLEARLQNLDGQNKTLASQLDEYRKMKEEGRLSVSSENWNLEQATRRFNEAEREIQRLSLELERERGKCVEQKAELEGMLFDPAVAERTQIERLGSLEASLKKAEKQIDLQKDQYEARVASLQGDQAEKDRRAQDAEKQLAAMKKDYEESQGRVVEAQKQLTALQEKMKQVDMASADADGKLAAQKAQYEQKIAALEQDLRAKTASANESGKQVAGLQSRLNALESSVKQAEAARDAEMGRIADAGAQAQDLRAKLMKVEADYKQKVATLEDEKTSLQTQLEMARNTTAQNQAEEKNIGQEVASLRAELAKVRTEQAQQIAKLLNEKADVAAQLQQAEARQSDLEREKSQLAARLESESGQSEQMAQLEREKADIAAKLLAAQTEQVQKLAALEKEKNTIAAQLQAAQAEESSKLAAAELEKAAMDARLADAKNAQAGKVAELEQQNKLIAAQLQLVQARQAEQAELFNKEKTEISTQLQATKAVVAATSGTAQATEEIAAEKEQAIAAMRAELAQKEAQYKESLARMEQENRSMKTAMQAAKAQPVPAAVAPVPPAAPAAAPAVPAPVEAASISPPENVAAADKPIVAPQPQYDRMNIAPVQTASYMTTGAMQSLLTQAGITTLKPVETVGKSGGAAYAAFQWDTGQVYGSAEQQAMENPAQFDGMVKDYIARTQKRCDGDFASSLAQSKTSARTSLTGYEIACVGGSGGASASLIFIGRDHTFTVIAHETSPDNMDIAMDNRDNIYKVLSATQTASR